MVVGVVGLSRSVVLGGGDAVGTTSLSVKQRKAFCVKKLEFSAFSMETNHEIIHTNRPDDHLFAMSYE